MERNNGIDLVRLIGAFCVLIVHVPYEALNSELANNLRLLSRWAVPFYFMVSGYFLGFKIENEKLDFEKIQHNIVRLLSVLIIASLIYAPFTLNAGINFYTIDKLLTGSFIHLWFIGSMVFAYISIWYLYYIRKNHYLPYIAGILLVIILIADSYDKFLKASINYDFFRFLLSIPFFYIGIYFSKKNISGWNLKVVFALILVGSLLQILEANFMLVLFDYSINNHQFLVGTILMAIPIFILSIRLKIKQNILTEWGRQYSLFIYMYHLFFLQTVSMIIAKSSPTIITNQFIFFSPILLFAITLSVAILFDTFLPNFYKLLIGEWNESKGSER